MLDNSPTVSHHHTLSTELRYHQKKSTSTNTIFFRTVHSQLVSTLTTVQLIITSSAHLTLHYSSTPRCAYHKHLLDSGPWSALDLYGLISWVTVIFSVPRFHRWVDEHLKGLEVFSSYTSTVKRYIYKFYRQALSKRRRLEGRLCSMQFLVFIGFMELAVAPMQRFIYDAWTEW